MNNVQIKIKLDPGATMPRRAHDTDVGYDITCATFTIVLPDNSQLKLETANQLQNAFSNVGLSFNTVIIDTGVHVTPGKDYYVELVPNSRQAKTSIRWGNSIGVIDPGYTGSIKIILTHSSFINYADLEAYLPGNVVGQLIIRRKYDAVFEQVKELEATERGEGGFGSTAGKETAHD